MERTLDLESKNLYSWFATLKTKALFEFEFSVYRIGVKLYLRSRETYSVH